MLYVILLALHNLTRWFVLIWGVWATYRLIVGWRQGRVWSRADSQVVRQFTWVFTIQFILGAALYLLPGSLAHVTATSVGSDVWLKNRVLRFFTLEHPLQMVIALGLSHIASAVTRRAIDDRRRFRLGAILLIIAMLLILVGIPWPFLDHGRPLLRFIQF